MDSRPTLDAKPALLESIWLAASFIARLFLYMNAYGMLKQADDLNPESAIHQILQQNMLATGYLLFVATAIWGATSWPRTRLALTIRL